jgi:hypothetical protein
MEIRTRIGQRVLVDDDFPLGHIWSRMGSTIVDETGKIWPPSRLHRRDGDWSNCTRANLFKPEMTSRYKGIYRKKDGKWYISKRGTHADKHHPKGEVSQNGTGKGKGPGAGKGPFATEQLALKALKLLVADVSKISKN